MNCIVCCAICLIKEISFKFIYSMFDNELVYVDKLIADDVRNNSAWNQRIFVLKYTGLSPESLQVELRYVTNRIQIVTENESSWNFLRGVLKLAGGCLDQYPEVNYLPEYDIYIVTDHLNNNFALYLKGARFL